MVVIVSQHQQQLAEIFKAVRQSLNLTQKELAEQFRVSPIYISYIENSRRLPSKKLLKQLYRLKNSPIPEDVLELLKSIKSGPVLRTDHATLYEIKAKGLYTPQALNKILKHNPESFVHLMALFRLYQDKGAFEKSRQLLEAAQPKIRDPHNQKWLQAYLYQINASEANYHKALDCMQEAVALFDAAHPQLDLRQRKQKSELLFRYATIYYDFAFFLFFKLDLQNPRHLERVQTQFKEALHQHNVLRQYHLYPYSQLDFANIFYWLATLEWFKSDPETRDTPRQIHYYERFIEEAKAALLFDHAEHLSVFPETPDYPFYPMDYKIDNGTFLALAHARLAQLNKPPQVIRFHLQEGELELARSTSLFSKYENSTYRYYYNFAHFYSLKAECLQTYALSPDDEAIAHALNLCEQALSQAQTQAPTQLSQELQLPSELCFYKNMRSDTLKRFTTKG